MYGENFSYLDAIAIVSFVLGLANYSKNTDQLQDDVNRAVFDMHKYIKEQEIKIDEILKILKEGGLYDDHQRG